MPGVLVLLGLLMVSRVPYPHAVHAIVRGRHSMPFLAALVIVIVLMFVGRLGPITVFIALSRSHRTEPVQS